jgi:hypothetical protein
MSARLESFLARLYVDESAREAYLADRAGEAARAGLDDGDRAAVARIDPVDLRLAAQGFARKRAHKTTPGRWIKLFASVLALLRRRSPR